MDRARLRASAGRIAPVVLAALLAGAALAEIWLQPNPAAASGWAQPRWLSSALALIAAAAVLVARRHPTPALLASAASAVASAVLVAPHQGPFQTFVALLVVTFVFGATAASPLGRRHTVTFLGTLAVVAVGVVVFGQGPDATPVPVWMAFAYAMGRLLGASHRRGLELERLTAELAAERDRRAAHAVTAERARISRELHDVVAHNISVLVVQAEAANTVFDDDPEAARAALSAIACTGRQTVDEMRRMLSMLRSHDDELALTPLPGLRQLPDLVAAVRAAGLPVDLVIDGDPVRLAAGLDLTAYRIIQEGLTNALKHAGAARATVTVRYGHDEITLQVVDDGAGPATAHTDGHGLVGMRERVTLFGGHLETGPRERGGWSLVARLPVNGS